MCHSQKDIVDKIRTNESQIYIAFKKINFQDLDILHLYTALKVFFPSMYKTD